MRGTKKVIFGMLAMLVGLMAVTACAGTNQSPESVSRAYISASAKMDFDKMLECNDFMEEYQNDEAKKAAKAIFDLGISMMPEDAKSELKTYSFKKYEKTNNEKVEETKETKANNTIVITERETGKIIITYKKDGKGEPLEKVLNTMFVKADGKWYIEKASLIQI